MNFLILFTTELLHEARINHAAKRHCLLSRKSFFQIKKFYKLTQRCRVA